MGAQQVVARQAVNHLLASAVGFGAALGVSTAFLSPQQQPGQDDGGKGEGRRELRLVQVVFR
jgi:hypothetical protein